LQASLTQFIRELFSFASVLDASALASEDLRGCGFVGDATGSIGPVSLIGFSRSKFPLSAHPARVTARSTANSQFIFASPRPKVKLASCPIVFSTRAVK